MTKSSLILLQQEVWVQTPENANYADHGKKKLQKVFSMVQRRIIEHGSHSAARSDAVRRGFSYDGRIVGYRIVYVIFLIVVIA